MNLRTAILAIAGALFLTAATTVQLASQEHNTKHHHYRLIDLGTFGGPSTWFNGGGRDLNNGGVASASGETTIADPFAPVCFLPECFVGYGFQWHNGVQTNLGVLPQGNATNAQDPCFDCGWTSFPAWITDNGLITGFSENNTMDSAAGVPTVLGVLWKDGKIFNLGTLGGAQSGAVSMNQKGDVVGTALNNITEPFPNRFPYIPNIYFANATETHAFLWQHGVMQDLGTLGGPDSGADFVNEHGQIAGQSDTNYDGHFFTWFGGFVSPNVHPFLWEKGKMRDLGSLGGSFGFPYGMNNRGDVVGWSDLAGDTSAHPFLWTKEHGLQDLGTLGGTFGHADFISEKREVVGTATLPGDPGLRAFLWKDGVMTNLGTLGNDPDSEAVAINSRGQIVGSTYILGVADLRGFLWENGGPMVDLNALVINGSGIQIVGLATINDRGEMAVPGVLANGDVHAYVMIPCDDDHPGVEGCDYSLVETVSATAFDSIRSGQDAPLNLSIPTLSGMKRAMVRRIGGHLVQ